MSTIPPQPQSARVFKAGLLFGEFPGGQHPPTLIAVLSDFDVAHCSLTQALGNSQTPTSNTPWGTGRLFPIRNNKARTHVAKTYFYNTEDGGDGLALAALRLIPFDLDRPIIDRNWEPTHEPFL